MESAADVIAVDYASTLTHRQYPLQQFLAKRFSVAQTESVAIPGSNIRLLRQQLGLSLRAMSEAIGMDPAGVSRLESGKGGYSHDSIEKIAKVLGVSVGTLFADPGLVEAAALRMRQVPVLTPAQLSEWKGPDELASFDELEILHAGIQRMSRYVFALRAPDDINAPELRKGDELIFDAKREPQHGEVVAAQEPNGHVHIGRLRVLKHSKGSAAAFEVLPFHGLDACASTERTTDLRLRGTLVEVRRSFPRHITK